MNRTDSGLFVAHNFSFLRYRATERTVTLPTGERAKVTVDDSGQVQQVEHGDHLDGTVRPKPIRLKLRTVMAVPALETLVRPPPIRTKARTNGPS